MIEIWEKLRLNGEDAAMSKNYTMKKRQSTSAFVHHYHTVPIAKDLKGAQMYCLPWPPESQGHFCRVDYSSSLQDIISSQGLLFALSILYL